jgi:hypothetical protein
MHDEAIGFNQDSPKEEATNQQRDCGERDADSFLPTRSTTPLPWARWATDLIKQKESEAEEDGNREKERKGHERLSIDDHEPAKRAARAWGVSPRKEFVNLVGARDSGRQIHE